MWAGFFYFFFLMSLLKAILLTRNLRFHQTLNMCERACYFCYPHLILFRLFWTELNRNQTLSDAHFYCRSWNNIFEEEFLLKVKGVSTSVVNFMMQLMCDWIIALDLVFDQNWRALVYQNHVLNQRNLNHNLKWCFLNRYQLNSVKRLSLFSNSFEKKKRNPLAKALY